MGLLLYLRLSHRIHPSSTTYLYDPFFTTKSNEQQPHEVHNCRSPGCRRQRPRRSSHRGKLFPFPVDPLPHLFTVSDRFHLLPYCGSIPDRTRPQQQQSPSEVDGETPRDGSETTPLLSLRSETIPLLLCPFEVDGATPRVGSVKKTSP